MTTYCDWIDVLPAMDPLDSLDSLDADDDIQVPWFVSYDSSGFLQIHENPDYPWDVLPDIPLRPEDV